tara:strand:- start:2283 stop:2420 length:138 start_codon:yes stop_codon:yes gene_type:complete
MEPLDMNNVIEIQQIKELLTDHPELLIMLEALINLANKKLNEEED